MTCGIYKLNFAGTDKVYIGQSVDIEDRFRQHLRFMRKGMSPKKLQAGYDKYGAPALSIIATCTTEELDSFEDEAIDIFDSYNNGFNSLQSSLHSPQLRGEEHGNAKFTNSQILMAATLLQDISYTFSNISKITGVSEDIVSKISSGHCHLWLYDEEPAIWANIKTLKNKRLKLNAYSRGDKISAKNQGIVYPRIQSPEGVVYTIENAYAFAREYGLRGNHLTEVLNGHRKSHMGWKLCQEELVL